MDASYNVTVDIQNPVENTTIAVNDDLTVKVVYTHDEGGTIHHVRITIEDDAGNVVATLIDGHQHVEGTFTFDEIAAYTAAAAGTFKIVARTMNMDMSIMKMAERTFTVQ
jgi:flagellar hook assembly protein FlgD